MRRQIYGHDGPPILEKSRLINEPKQWREPGQAPAVTGCPGRADAGRTTRFRQDPERARAPRRGPPSRASRRGRRGARSPRRRAPRSLSEPPCAQSSTSAAPARPWHRERSPTSSDSASSRRRRVAASAGPIFLRPQHRGGPQARQRDARLAVAPSPERRRRERVRPPATVPAEPVVGPRPVVRVDPRALVRERALGARAKPRVTGRLEQRQKGPADPGRAVGEPAEMSGVTRIRRGPRPAVGVDRSLAEQRLPVGHRRPEVVKREAAEDRSGGAVHDVCSPGTAGRRPGRRHHRLRACPNTVFAEQRGDSRRGPRDAHRAG